MKAETTDGVAQQPVAPCVTEDMVTSGWNETRKHDWSITGTQVRRILKAALSTLPSTEVPAQAAWQPIETAPRDFTPIDVWFVLTDTQAARWANVRWSEEHQTWSGGPPSQYEGGWKATHWMPVSEGPVVSSTNCAAPPSVAMESWPPKFEPMKLQARPADGGDWIDIFPAQLEVMVRNGCSVRALEAVTAVAGTERGTP